MGIAETGIPVGPISITRLFPGRVSPIFPGKISLDSTISSFRIRQVLSVGVMGSKDGKASRTGDYKLLISLLKMDVINLTVSLCSGFLYQP